MCHTHEAKYDFKENVFAHYMHFTVLTLHKQVVLTTEIMGNSFQLL